MEFLSYQTFKIKTMENLTQWRSTLIGLIALVVPVLVIAGWISAEQEVPLISNLGNVVEAIFGLAGAIGGLWAVFHLNDEED